MAGDNNSFDIVSTVDLQEVRNAMAQAEKEIGNRYDLKKAAAEVTLEKEELLAEILKDLDLRIQSRIDHLLEPSTEPPPGILQGVRLEVRVGSDHARR